jgi:hypothetical protein
MRPHSRFDRSFRRRLAIVAAVVVMTLSSATPAPTTGVTFTDIGGSSFRDQIVWLVDKGIASGCAPSRFCPEAQIQRGQLAAFMARAFDLPPTSEDFFDDDDGHMHEASINRLAAAGLASGCVPGLYCPEWSVTRAQLAAFFARAFDLAPTKNDYFYDDAGMTLEISINRLAASGIAAGCASARFCPGARVTREQFAAFLYRAMNSRLTPPPVLPTTAAIAGVWIGGAELAWLPTSGPAWESVVDAAADAGTNGNVSDQDSNHDQATLAAALYTARTGQQRARAVAALESAIGTERDGDGRWLEVGRNLLGYIIAADLLGIRSGPVYDWLASFRTMRLAHNNSGQPITFRESAWQSGSNASAQEGAVYAALGVYLKDTSMQRWSWDAFRRYAGDRSSQHRISSNSDIWQQNPDDPVGIQNPGATRNGCSIDGAISNDMSRGSDDVCDPGYTQYPWVGLEGAVPAAMVLSRAGFPAWDVADRALRRAAVYLKRLRDASGESEWYDNGRAPEIKHLLNRVYGLGYPVEYTVGGGRTVGFTDWTHP